MGNLCCFAPLHTASESTLDSARGPVHGRGQAGKLSPNNSRTLGNSFIVLPPTTSILTLARTALGLGDFPSVHVEVLCALALVLSNGTADCCRWCSDCEEYKIGLCQMTLSTAELLVLEHGYDAFGLPTKETLTDKVAALYFAAARLQQLAACGNLDRISAYIIRSYVLGPKCMTDQDDGVSADQWDEMDLFEHNFERAMRHMKHLSDLREKAAGRFAPMHVVESGESLATIAKACKTSGSEILELNPEIRGSVRCGDCISLPHECLPRLVCTCRRSSWGSLGAKLYTPPSRLRLNNRDALLEASAVPMDRGVHSQTLLKGQLLEIPGLGNGSSICCDDGNTLDAVPASGSLFSTFSFEGPRTIHVFSAEAPYSGDGSNEIMAASSSE